MDEETTKLSQYWRENIFNSLLVVWSIYLVYLLIREIANYNFVKSFVPKDINLHIIDFNNKLINYGTHTRTSLIDGSVIYI